MCVALALGSCTTYEYEEEVFLDVDGSGSLRISGSRAFLGAVDPRFDGELSSITRAFTEPAFAVDSVRQTRRDERAFVHVQGSFRDWNELCGTWWFRERDCRLDVSDDALSIHMAIRGESRRPDTVAPDAPVAFRFHFPSTVRFHNSGNEIERGNIIRWERTAEEYFAGRPLTVEARFEQRSVLRTTAVILGTALGLVIFSVGAALVWTLRVGRRQLAEDALPDDG